MSADGIAGSIGNVGNPGGDVAKATDSVNKALAESSKAAQSLKDAFKPSLVSVEVVGFGDCSSEEEKGTEACRKAAKKAKE